MIDYNNTLAFGFALGVWRGLLDANSVIDQHLGEKTKPSEIEVYLTAYPALRIGLLIVWIFITAGNSSSLRGFLHFCAMPIGLYKISHIAVGGGAQSLISLPFFTRLDGKRLRRWATVVGLILFSGSCVPMLLTDPCNKADVYCEEPDWF